MRDSEAIGNHVPEPEVTYWWSPKKYDWLDQMLFGTGERVKIGEGSIHRPYENGENY